MLADHESSEFLYSVIRNSFSVIGSPSGFAVRFLAVTGCVQTNFSVFSVLVCVSVCFSMFAVFQM